LTAQLGDSLNLLPGGTTKKEKRKKKKGGALESLRIREEPLTSFRTNEVAGGGNILYSNLVGGAHVGKKGKNCSS